jgi:hypothetical protein
MMCGVDEAAPEEEEAISTQISCCAPIKLMAFSFLYAKCTQYLYKNSCRSDEARYGTCTKTLADQTEARFAILESGISLPSSSTYLETEGGKAN